MMALITSGCVQCGLPSNMMALITSGCGQGPCGTKGKGGTCRGFFAECANPVHFHNLSQYAVGTEETANPVHLLWLCSCHFFKLYTATVMTRPVFRRRMVLEELDTGGEYFTAAGKLYIKPNVKTRNSSINMRRPS